MGHGTADGRRWAEMTPQTVAGIAETLQALGTTSRLRILLRLRDGPCPVGALAENVGMEQSAVSHQLRVLRHLGLVGRSRDGRHVNYHLHDDHVASLLDEALYHVEHVRLGRVDEGAGGTTAGATGSRTVGRVERGR